VKPATRATLSLLRQHPEGVTALTALDEIGSFRLGARIYELKAEGYEVVTDLISTASGKRIARYRLVEQMELAL
jgi:hypothetical protein